MSPLTKYLLRRKKVSFYKYQIAWLFWIIMIQKSVWSTCIKCKYVYRAWAHVVDWKSTHGVECFASSSVHFSLVLSPHEHRNSACLSAIFSLQPATASIWLEVGTVGPNRAPQSIDLAIKEWTESVFLMSHWLNSDPCDIGHGAMVLPDWPKGVWRDSQNCTH